MKKILFLIFVLALIVYPRSIFAQLNPGGEYEAHLEWDGQSEDVNISYEGIIPCARGDLKVNGETFREHFKNSFCQDLTYCEMPCTLCHIFVMIDNVLDFIIELSIYVALFMIVIGGGMITIAYTISPGNPGLLDTGRKTVTATAIGIGIIFGAWLFTNLFFNIIGVAEWTGLQEGWFVINCPITISK